MKTIKSQGFIPLVLLALICSVLRTRYNYVKKTRELNSLKISLQSMKPCATVLTQVFFNEPMNNVLVQQFAECTLRWIVLRD